MYYPKSQIKSNLYTNGKDFILATTKKPYTGDYYEIPNGDAFTGKAPNEGVNTRLIPSITSEIKSLIFTDETQEIIEDEITVEYRGEYSSNVRNRYIPKSYYSQPTQKDYDLGKYIRYFTKKNNENIYFEIDKETYQNLLNQDINIAWDLYFPILITWTLTGEEDKIFLTNKNIVILAETNNQLYGFSQWFRDDFLKYYKDLEIQEDLTTDGTEFINRRTKLPYKGPYHIHPKKGPMVGAKHIKRQHDYLDPILQIIDSLTYISQGSPTSTSGGGGSTSGGGGGYSGGGGGY